MRTFLREFAALPAASLEQNSDALCALKVSPSLPRVRVCSRCASMCACVTATCPRHGCTARDGIGKDACSGCGSCRASGSTRYPASQRVVLRCNVLY